MKYYVYGLGVTALALAVLLLLSASFYEQACGFGLRLSLAWRSFSQQTDYVVPEKHQKSALDIDAFYQTQSQQLDQAELDNRRTFYSEKKVGSVLNNGFNAALPENARWQGGKLRVGAHIKSQVTQAKEASRIRWDQAHKRE